jgi:hypothetical protein
MCIRDRATPHEAKVVATRGQAVVWQQFSEQANLQGLLQACNLA